MPFQLIKIKIRETKKIIRKNYIYKSKLKKKKVKKKENIRIKKM